MTNTSHVSAEILRNIEWEITKLLTFYARTVDDQQYHQWLDLFSEDGIYAVMTHENYLDQGLYLHREDKEGMKARAAHLLGVWQNPRGKTLHVVSNIDFEEVSEELVVVRSYLTVYRTEKDGETKLHTCGCAVDRLVKEGDRWLFREREVTVDNSLLPYNFTELL